MPSAFSSRQSRGCLSGLKFFAFGNQLTGRPYSRYGAIYSEIGSRPAGLRGSLRTDAIRLGSNHKEACPRWTNTRAGHDTPQDSRVWATLSRCVDRTMSERRAPWNRAGNHWTLGELLRRPKLNRAPNRHSS